MTIHAFTDGGDGYYQVDVVDGETMPKWASNMTPCPIQPVWPMVSITPHSVSRFQARAALLQAGLLDDIEAYMALNTTDAFTKLAWKDAQDFNRSSPMVEAIGQLIGLTSEQLDDLFMFASTITA